MSYLALDLDAKKLVPRVARACGLSPGDVLWGLAELWELAWLAKRDTVDEVELTGCIGATPGLVPALVSFGFLEPVDGLYRVKGADKYLRVSEGRSKGGKAASGNLKRGTKRAEGSREPETAVPGLSPASAGSEPRLVPGLSPSTEHRAPIKETTTFVEQAPPSSAASDVFAHWQKTLNHPRAKFDGKRRRAVEARLKEGRTADELKLAVDGCAKTPHNQGKNDRGEVFDDLELICRNDAQVERFIRNARAPPLPASSRNEPAPSDYWDSVPPEGREVQL